jgi:glycyl-tRNA synthetase beta chain
MAARLEEHRLSFERCSAWGTPRRLVLLVRALASRQPHRRQRVKGPPLERAYDSSGAPTKALHGFARSQGLSPEALMVEQVNGTPYLFADKELSGEAAETLLPEILSGVLRGISSPRPMYWENKGDRFPRPVRWLLAFYGSAALSFTFAGVLSGRETFGHRLLSPGPITVGSIDDYFDSLGRNRVILDQEKRREMIREELAEKAAAVGGRPLIDEALLEEVTYLVEYPVAVTGSFDRSYLELPREVLITTMQVHQRYFPCAG